MSAVRNDTSVRTPVSTRKTAVGIVAAFALFLQSSAAQFQPIPSAGAQPASTPALAIAPDEGARLLRYPSEAKPGGIYALERALTFNVLESVYYDPASGRLALTGRYDERFQGPSIPYLQHLATLLELQQAEFTLKWTTDPANVLAPLKAKIASPEFDRQLNVIFNGIFDDRDGISTPGRHVLSALRAAAVTRAGSAGYLGAEAESAPDGAVRITAIASDSPAADIGLRVGDLITSIDGKKPLHAREFRRIVRFVGAGKEARLSYQRAAKSYEISVTLAADADPDPWSLVTRYDVEAAFYRATQMPERARAMYALGVLKSLADTPAAGPALLELAHAVGSAPNVAADPDPRRSIVRRLDEIFGLGGGPTLSVFNAALAAGAPADAAFVSALGRFESELEPTPKKLIEHALQSPSGLQLDPQLVQAMLGIRPEMTPKFIGLAPNTLLARALFDADYVSKQIANRGDLGARVPRYKNEFEFAGSGGGSDASQTCVGVDKIGLASSPSGDTLAFRSVTMHFNIRGPDVINRCDQKPAPGSYEELLSSLYDDFAREYFTLHELREVMKLAAAAEWIRKRNASFRLPAEGRIDWHSPARVPGLVYLYMTKQRVVTSANGGVRLTPFPPGSVNETFNDPSVVDARHLPLIKAPPPDLARSALAKVAAPPPTASPIGWVKSTSIKGQDLQVVSLTPGAAASAGQLQLSRSSDQSAASLSATNNLAAEAGEYRRLIAATSDPTIQAGYRLGLARVLHEQGDDAAAIKEVRQAQSLAPNHPGLLVLAAEAQLKSGDTKGAIDSLRRYVALAPYNWPAKSLLSELEAQEQFGVMPRPVADPGVGSRSGIAWKSKSQLVGLANVMAEPGAAPCWDISKGCRQGAATVPQFASRLPPLPPLPPQYKTDKAAIELWNKQIAAYDDFTKTQHSLNDIAFKKETNSATPKDLADEAKLLDDQAKKQKEIDENKEKMKQYVLVD